MEREEFVGIDFGTTGSSAAIFKHGNSTMISSVMGSCCEETLKRLKSESEANIGTEITRAVISIPSCLNMVQRRRVCDMAARVGFYDVRLIHAGSSAAVTYFMDCKKEQTIMICDLGGGTFDVSIVEYSEGVIETLAVAGDQLLGGASFNARIEAWLVDEFYREYGIDLRQNRDILYRVRTAIEKAKIELSFVQSTTIELPYLLQVDGAWIGFERTLTREKFQEMTANLVERIGVLVEQALADADISAMEIANVFFIGNAVRMPMIQERLFAVTGKKPLAKIHPKEAVAIGAAIQADNFWRDGNEDFLVLDAMQVSFWLEVDKKIIGEIKEYSCVAVPVVLSLKVSADILLKHRTICVIQGEGTNNLKKKEVAKIEIEKTYKLAENVEYLYVSCEIEHKKMLLLIRSVENDMGEKLPIKIAYI